MGFSDYVHLRKLIQLVTRWGKNFLRLADNRTLGRWGFLRDGSILLSSMAAQ